MLYPFGSAKIGVKKGALDAYALPVATAYHSRFMEQSSARLLSEINKNHLRDPRIPLISYLFLESVPNKEEFKRIVTAQLSRPVLWVDLIKRLRNRSIRLLVEVGPGAVICKTVKWIDRNIETVNSATKERLLRAIGRYRML